MNTININGNYIVTSGTNITVKNGKVYVDGEDCTPDSKEIHIKVEGNIDVINADACNTISITGDAKDVKSQSGNIKIDGNISGNASCMSGDIKCGNIGGNASTMSGDIKRS